MWSVAGAIQPARRRNQTVTGFGFSGVLVRRASIGRQMRKAAQAHPRMRLVSLPILFASTWFRMAGRAAELVADRGGLGDNRDPRSQGRRELRPVRDRPGGSSFRRFDPCGQPAKSLPDPLALVVS
ncbi:hypothetical protein B0T44_02770 [Nocardia donostiensis]|nr:hypothetical protein B0T44_02770 [Nocardia donostiensis]